MRYTLLIKATPRHAQRIAASHGLCLRVNNVVAEGRETVGTVVTDKWDAVMGWFCETRYGDCSEDHGYPSGTLLSYTEN